MVVENEGEAAGRMGCLASEQGVDELGLLGPVAEVERGEEHAPAGAPRAIEQRAVPLVRSVQHMDGGRRYGEARQIRVPEGMVAEAAQEGVRGIGSGGEGTSGRREQTGRTEAAGTPRRLSPKRADL